MSVALPTPAGDGLPRRRSSLPSPSFATKELIASFHTVQRPKAAFLHTDSDQSSSLQSTPAMGGRLLLPSDQSSSTQTTPEMGGQLQLPDVGGGFLGLTGIRAKAKSLELSRPVDLTNVLGLSEEKAEVRILKPDAAKIKDVAGSVHSSSTPSAASSLEREEAKMAAEKHGYDEPTSYIGKALLAVRVYLDRHYILTNPSPAIVLPRAPDDKEKYSYINTRRPYFLSLGLFGLLSTSAGLWLFTLAAPYFYWYGPITIILQVHVLIAYGLGAFARDFDLAGHNKILEEHPITADNAPTVDVYLPVCKEPLSVLRNTWNHVAKLRYPVGRLQVHVLDDGALDWVQELAQEFGFHYVRRADRPYFRKAGNLRHAYSNTSGDFFTIFDADFCPRDDFLLETIPRMLHGDKIAILQTPQYFRTRKENTWVERGASEVQELFYRWSQVNRDRWNASICVGSNALYRREALKAVGGTALVGASEDVHTGFYAITRGWTLRYMPICLAAGISPDTPRACFSQQIRWSQGSTSLLLNGDFHKAKLGFATKVCFMSGMLYYWTTSIAMFTVPLPGLLIVWARPALLRYYNLAFAVPSLIYSLLIYRVWSSNSHSMATEQIRVLQAYAYLFGIKDRILGRTHEWVSSGADSKSHKKANPYESARRVAICWTVLYQGLFVSGVTWRLVQGMSWFDPLPQIILYAFNLYLSLPFLLSP